MINYSFKSRIYPISIFAATASILQLLEIYFIFPIPFLKIGLANSIILMLIYKRLYLEGVLVNLIRILAGGFFSGRLFSLPFIFSLSGGVMSFIAMLIFFILFRKLFSLTTVSITGALTHNFTQLFLLNYFFINSSIGFNLVLPITLFSCVSGFFVALFSSKLISSVGSLSVKS
ncbi:MAG: hypothetical protein CR982_08260 [Candidatus Cloacimonadota bacterium]|nr:MAG: hypothetical protein CR982_08260 [Candidatus Cloacimonadota bacterium]PIE79045.1 MAG: hypothetical protein CSA15_04705 [Candidatus Delongbacteria bacterium]